MSTLIDSYSETNYNHDEEVYNNQSADSQSFSTDSSSYILTSCKFYLYKVGSPTGNAVAKLYAHSGTYGTNSVPTGSPLTTSDNFDVSTLSGSMQLIEFTFPNTYIMTANTYYCIVFEYTGGDGANLIRVGDDTSSPTHGGNIALWTTSWQTINSRDACFYVYGTRINQSGFFQLI